MHVTIVHESAADGVPSLLLPVMRTRYLLLTLLYLINVVMVQRLRYAGLSSKGITICTLCKMMALGYRVHSNQKALNVCYFTL